MSKLNIALAAALDELPSLRRVLIVVWFGFGLSVATTIARCGSHATLFLHILQRFHFLPSDLKSLSVKL
jgi:hypothetical protein